MSPVKNTALRQRSTGNSRIDSLLDPSYAMSLLRTNNHSGNGTGPGDGPETDMAEAIHPFDMNARDLDSSDASPVVADDMMEKAEAASGFLKALSHEGRLMILCHLSTGEKTVTELENLLSSRQAAVSQQLARLRLEGLVACRREGKAIYYSLADDRARRTIELVYDMFCNRA